ncbi:protein kinase [Trypanosoma cruzi Dm28c]|uniref:Protein kinase n=1 Tax=Trypanosoma cruzi Dm28c TaxID=1416333 RepID=V5BA99_TRYCR|nr:protein kinase [Trypanosoma cruzi Dm28c]
MRRWHVCLFSDSFLFSFSFCLNLPPHTHTHIYIYIYFTLPLFNSGGRETKKEETEAYTPLSLPVRISFVSFLLFLLFFFVICVCVWKLFFVVVLSFTDT